MAGEEPQGGLVPSAPAPRRRVQITVIKTYVRTLLIERPEGKLGAFIVTTLASNFLTGSLITEITHPDGIHWKEIPFTYSFYGLLLLLLLVYIYFVYAHRHEHNVLRFSNEEYIRSYVRSQCIPEVVDKYRRAVRDGNETDLKSAKSELSRFMK